MYNKAYHSLSRVLFDDQADELAVYDAIDRAKRASRRLEKKERDRRRA